jgi:hypothetical protein
MSEYFNVEAISYSTLRNLSIGPAYHKFIQEQDSEEKEHFIIGGGVDILLTEPEKFWDYYALEFQEICEKVPTPQIRDYSYYILNGKSEEEAYKEVGFKRDSLDAVREKFNNEAKEWFNWMKNKLDYDESVKNKQILTNTQYSLITKIVESLKTNQFTSKYFNTSFDGSEEVFNQLEIYWEVNGQKCKSKLDKVVVNHKNKTIQPIDIKTTGKSTFSFSLSALSYRYDIQTSFYTSGLYWLINKSNDTYWSKIKDYQILPFIFIVESTKTPGLPLIYKVTDTFLAQGMEGFMKDGKYYKGWVELLNEYVWYKENNSWTYDKQIIENEGVVKLEYVT